MSKRSTCVLPLFVACALVLSASSVAVADYNGYYYQATEYTNYNLPYWIYVPDNYDPSRSYPLMMYLHGSGNAGTDNSGPSSHPSASALRAVASQEETAAFVIVPQTANSWQASSQGSQAVFELIDKELIERQGYNIDVDRVYVTGFSLGGIGAMSWTGTYPERFAAIAPFAGSVYFGSDTATLAGNRAQVATWAFSGGNDGTVPGPQCAIELGHQRALGGDPLHTTFPGAGHMDTWRRVGDEEVALYPWMLAQRNGQPNDMSMFVGWEANTNETTTLNGPGESVTRTDPYFAGYYGTGTLEVKGGATMTNTTGYVAAQKYGRGNAIVDGAGSRWVNSGTLYVGYAAPGTLHVANGGEVAAGTVDVSFYSYLTGNGLITGDVNNRGHLQPGDVPVALTAANLSGVNGGRRPPAISLAGGLNVNADLLGAPGSSCGVLDIDGDYSQFVTAILEIELGGSQAGEFDALNVTGSVSLGGTLEVAMANDYVPSAGELYEIIRSENGSVTGRFGDVEGLHAGNGYRFQVIYGPSSVMLLTAEELAGDANFDGRVNESDFWYLKNNFGATDATWAQGDFDLNGVVDIPDFVILKNNYGAIESVPEPATIALLAMGASLTLRRRRR